MIGIAKNMSLKWKLIWIILLITWLALSLTLFMYIASEIISYRRVMISDLESMARIMGRNTSAALTFNDPEAAVDTLNSLLTEPFIIDARIYDASDKLFAFYHSKGPGQVTRQEKNTGNMGALKREADMGILEGIRFWDNFIDVFVPIEFDGTHLGTVYMKQDMSRLKKQVFFQFKISLLILTGALLLAFVLARHLQRLFTAPIHSLTTTMKRICGEKDYTFQLQEDRKDEIGSLVTSFNRMLVQIHKRDRQLEAHKLHLEDEVVQRTEDLHQTMEDLKQAKEKAEASDKAKSVFLANMSHELRTPLNHIIGFTELIVDQHFGEINNTQADYLGDVLTSSRHLLSLINDILDLSKIEAGKMKLDLTAVDLKVLLANSLVMIKEKAMKHGIRLHTDMDGMPEEIRADERKLKQILYNLLSNSVKFTPDGGEIRLQAKLIQGQSPALIQISVADTGIGLDPENMVRIFDAFEQVENSASRKFQGTGLGLSLTKNLVALHGGKIWADSKGEGKGTTVSFVFPVDPKSI